MKFEYDVIVVGGGHAGCEAALAAANLGSKSLLISMDMNKIAQMSCNPAIGGIAKGQIVREIDALGGAMGFLADQTTIQFRMLNKSKGPAMWSPRAQIDRRQYIKACLTILEKVPNLSIWQDTVSQLLIKNENEVYGVKTLLGVEFLSATVILTNGTFLNGVIHVGKSQLQGGRLSEPASYNLTEQLCSLGIKTDRMKTGTPPRIDIRSIYFDEMLEQAGDDDFHKFSYLDNIQRSLKQLSCWTLFTNEDCHQVLRDGLEESPLYNGQIKSVGPRYCPSVETKILIFPNKSQHQLFLEPEAESSNEYYLNGFSTSLPISIQLKALKKIPAFRDIKIYRPGYAIEYDFFDPTQLYHTLESKIVNNLYIAGQINGTTGYEEAAGQGLIAGINAHLKCNNSNPFILKRDEAYIGVLIDDLITKGVNEPYRMFTSRAEYRILLRQDNSDLRLTEKAYNLGLASPHRHELLFKKKNHIDSLLAFTSMFHVKPDQINSFLEKNNTTSVSQKSKLIEIIKRPTIKLAEISTIIPELQIEIEKIPLSRREEVIEETEIEMKYSGYIKREQQVAEKIRRLENISIHNKFNYETIQALSIEARQKLNRINPETIAQASRIPGISPNDINILLVMLNR